MAMMLSKIGCITLHHIDVMRSTIFERLGRFVALEGMGNLWASVRSLRYPNGTGLSCALLRQAALNYCRSLLFCSVAYAPLCLIFLGIARWRRTHNPLVPSSTLGGPTRNFREINHLCDRFPFLFSTEIGRVHEVSIDFGRVLYPLSTMLRLVISSWPSSLNLAPSFVKNVADCTRISIDAVRAQKLHTLNIGVPLFAELYEL